MQGKVKYFNPDRGFGFLKSHDGDVFVHIRDVQCTIAVDVLEIGDMYHSTRMSTSPAKCAPRTCGGCNAASAA